jgi:small-conductance mechanosensitive channel
MAHEPLREEPRGRIRALLAAAVLTGCLGAVAVGAARAAGAELPPAPGSSERGAPTLFAPEPLGFDRGTVERLVVLVRALPDEGPALLRQIAARGRQVGVAASALLLLFLAAIALVVALQRPRARWVESGLEPVLAEVASPLRPWIAALARIAAAALPPLLLVLLHELVRRVTGFAGPGFLLLAIGLRAWFVWALVTSSLRELLIEPLLPISSEHGRYLFRATWWLVSASLVLSALLEVAARAGAASDMLALLASLLELATILVVAAFATHKRAVLGLLPDLPSRAYRASVRLLAHFYPVVLLLTLGTALLDWAGYVALASRVWRCSWALAALLFALAVGLHLARLGLRRILGAHPTGNGPAEALCRSATRLVDLAGALLVIHAALELVGARVAVAAALGAPVLRLGDHAVSPSMVIEASVVVAGFWLGARVLRDFLAYRVYPALAIDESIAHAINTFIGYATLVVGVLVAFEVVGLGAGTVTVFAGALGIGLGFGMQSLAGDLSSGVTLIFGRTLRKGDIVRIGETTGQVQEVGIRATSLMSPDAVEYLVPNSEMVSSTVVNWTRSTPFVREHVPLGVGYGADPEEVIDLLQAVAKRVPGVEAEPEPEVWFTGLGESSLSFEVLVWVDFKKTARQRVRSDLYRAIFAALRSAGIEIPYPQRDLHIRSVSPEALEVLPLSAETPAATRGAHASRRPPAREGGPVASRGRSSSEGSVRS